MYDDENDDPPGIRTVKIGVIAAKTNLPTATIWGLVDQGRFPLPIKLTPGRSCWLLTEVDAWILERAAEPRRSPFHTTNRRKVKPSTEKVIAFPSRRQNAETARCDGGDDPHP